MEKQGHIITCPVCNREFQYNVIEEHVNKCLFLTQNEKIGDKSTSKRSSSHLGSGIPDDKRRKFSNNDPVKSKVFKVRKEK